MMAGGQIDLNVDCIRPSWDDETQRENERLCKWVTQKPRLKGPVALQQSEQQQSVSEMTELQKGTGKTINIESNDRRIKGHSEQGND